MKNLSEIDNAIRVLIDNGKNKNDARLINIISITNLPPGVGINQNQVIQFEKYFSCARYKPISFWAIVPINTKNIIHIMVNTNIIGLLILSKEVHIDLEDYFNRIRTGVIKRFK